MQSRRPGRIAVITFALLVAPAVAGSETEWGLVSGLLLPDKSLLGGSPQRVVPEVGLRGGFVSGQYGWFIDGTFARIGIDDAKDIDWLNARMAVEFLSNRHTTRKQFFVTLGGGWLEAEQGPAKIDGWFGSVSIGQRFRPSLRVRVRWELRGDYSLSLDGTDKDLAAVHGTVALTWGLGVEKPDSDGDGVRDHKDDCPDTPAGAAVDQVGCPLDSDGDGVYDGLDRCPGTPRGWPVDDEGCPLDSDGDGVADGEDLCPGTPKGALVDVRGCPLDSDGDGVYNGIDRCPGTPAGARVDATGCPLDSDGDGVYDGLDRCAGTPAGARVDATGCSLDSDGDGVYDGLDRCPDTPRGTVVDAVGCAVPAPLFETDDDEPLVLEGVNFGFNSTELTATAREKLDEVAASLLHYTDVRVEIGGHTDSRGPGEFNQQFSRKRADAVRRYLIGRGVPASRLFAVGFGESQPIANESTPGGAAKNRRVELRRLN